MNIEHNFPDNLDWIKNKTILLTVTGSHAYGTNTVNSDIDYKGVCIPPEEYYLGLKSFNNYNSVGSKNFKNSIDITILHINKFVIDAMQGVPNNIEILFVNPEHIVFTNEYGKELISKRNDFLSKIIKNKFGGYAYSQIQKLKAKNINGTGRQDLINKYGYDTKYAYHSVRLLTSAIEILKTGNFNTYRPNKNELINIRNGKYSFDELLSIITHLDNELTELYETSNIIPNKPDYYKINSWLININKKALERGFCEKN
jgi:predicted nucleotidyltransferase